MWGGFGVQGVWAQLTPVVDPVGHPIPALCNPLTDQWARLPSVEVSPTCVSYILREQGGGESRSQ